jgi:hypothetical protein
MDRLPEIRASTKRNSPGPSAVPVDLGGVTARPAAEDGAGRAHRAFVFTAVLIGAVLLVTFTAELPDRVVPRWLAEREAVNGALWPQRWFFFAQVSRHDVHVLYSVGRGGPALVTEPQLVRDELWGVRRSGGEQIAETDAIFRQVPPRYWTACAALDPSACWVTLRGEAPYSMQNHTRVPRFCGPLMAAVERPARWTGDPHLPALVMERAAVVDVACAR